MHEFGMYIGNSDKVSRWKAERENASARLEIAQMKEAARLLVSQYDPVHSLGIDRKKLEVLLSFVCHHRDTSRLRRESESLGGTLS